MNKAWAQPPFDHYIASLAGALASVECEIKGGPSRADRGVEAAIAALKAMRERDRVCWLVGNGGSGTIADHIATDLVLGGYQAGSLTNSALTTTMGNDFGWERMFAKQLQRVARPGDMLIVMSCTGESANVLTAVANTPPLFKLALSGFKADNPLRKLGCDVSFYVPSTSYGEVQIAHLAVLHAIVDLAAGVP